mgnify:CR=1 FL=1
MSFISWLPSTYLFQTCIYTDLLAENISIRDKNFILWRSSLSQYLQGILHHYCVISSIYNVETETEHPPAVCVQQSLQGDLHYYYLYILTINPSAVSLHSNGIA